MYCPKRCLDCFGLKRCARSCAAAAHVTGVPVSKHNMGSDYPETFVISPDMVHWAVYDRRRYAIYLNELATGKPVATVGSDAGDKGTEYSFDDGEVPCLVLTPRGTFLAVSSDDGALIELTFAGELVREIELDGNDRPIAAACGGGIIAVLTTRTVCDECFDEDGSMVEGFTSADIEGMMGDEVRCNVTLLYFESGTVLSTFKPYEGYRKHGITGITLSSDGRVFLVDPVLSGIQVYSTAGVLLSTIAGDLLPAGSCSKLLTMPNGDIVVFPGRGGRGDASDDDIDGIDDDDDDGDGDGDDGDCGAAAAAGAPLGVVVMTSDGTLLSRFSTTATYNAAACGNMLALQSGGISGDIIIFK